MTESKTVSRVGSRLFESIGRWLFSDGFTYFPFGILEFDVECYQETNEKGEKIMACVQRGLLPLIKKRKAFTLAEILIVVAIITVLVAVGIPIFIARLAHTRETVCLSNRQSLTRQLRYEMMTDGLNMEKAEEIRGSYDAICPEDGQIDIHLVPDVSVTVTCSIHGGEGGGGGSNTDPASLEKYLKDFKDFVNENYSTVGDSNDQLRSKFFDEYGHPTMVIDGVTYYIEPFYNQHSQGDRNDRIWLFAKTTSGNGNWNGSYVYNPENGQWYQAMKKYDGSTSQPAYVGAYENVQDLVDALENEKCDKGDANRWKPVSHDNIDYKF